MPETPTQYWLLTGEVPTGPFTAAQVHAELAAGRANWQTPACPVGGSAWLPLVRTPGIGPSPVIPAPPPDEPAVAGEPGGLSGGSPSAADAGPVHPNPPNRFWLLVGAETTGPFRAAHIRAMLQAGELSPDAKARRVGSDTWVPLAEVVGALPPRPPAVPKAPAATPPAATANAGERTGVVGAAVGVGVVLLVLAGVGYGVYRAYEWLRPPTATEVCKKIDAAGTAAEAKKYATPRMHPLLDALYADRWTLDPNDAFEFTRETDGPQADTKLVGFRGSWYDAEAARRVAVEGHVRMVRADGWKADDMVFTGVEGVALPGPMSLVDEYRRSVAPPAPAGAKTPGRVSRMMLPPKPWYVQYAGAIAFVVFAVAGGIAQSRRGRAGKPSA